MVLSSLPVAKSFPERCPNVTVVKFVPDSPTGKEARTKARERFVKEPVFCLQRSLTQFDVVAGNTHAEMMRRNPS